MQTNILPMGGKEILMAIPFGIFFYCFISIPSLKITIIFK